MGRVTQLAGRSGWYVEFWHPGRRRNVRKRIKGSRRDAERLLREYELQARRQADGLESLANNEMEVEELVTAWHAWCTGRVRPRTWEQYRWGLKDVLPWLVAEAGVATVRDIRLADLERWKAARLGAGLAERTVAMRAGALRQMLRWGVRQGLTASNPLEAWRPPRGEPRRKRRALTLFEITEILKASPPELADVWRVLLETGLRPGELVQLEWTDVDLEADQLVVRGETSKGRRGRVVPMGAGSAAVVRGLRLRVAEREVNRHLVFVSPHGAAWGTRLGRRFKRIAEAVGLRRPGERVGVDCYHLRHTFGSHTVAAGVDARTVAEIMGHQDATMVLRVYAHAFAERKREAVDVWSEAIEAAASSARRARAVEERA